MPKSLKIVLSILIGIPLLLIVVIGIFMSINDANSFKPTLQSQAKQLAGINLQINGDLSWSLFPLGININELTILDQENKTFASINKIIAEVDLVSIIKQKPRIKNVLLDGLKLELIQTSQTEANWNNLLPHKESATTKQPSEKTVKVEETKESKDTNETKSDIDFLVDSFEIRNAQLHFKSLLKSPDSKQDITINPINLTLSNIALDKDIPIALNFDINDKINDLTIKSKIKSRIKLSKDFKIIEIQQFESEHQIASPTLLADVEDKSVTLKLNTNLSVNTQIESVKVKNFALKVAELGIKGNAQINHYSKQLTANGQINIGTFSLKSYLQKLGIRLPKMQNPNALSQTGFKTDFKLKNDQLMLSNLIFQMDSSHWQGDVQFGLKNQAVTAKLSGDQFNIDHYLPPLSNPGKQTQTESAQVEKTSTTEKPNKPNTPLLPLETIRALNVNIQLKQQKLIAHQIETTDIDLQFEAKDGKLSLNKLNGKLYQGEYTLSALVDARSNTPTWSGKQRIKKVNIGALLKALPEVKAQPNLGIISGELDFNASEQSKGNTLASLQQFATAKAQFDIQNGAIEDISLNAMACKGFAMINGDSVNTDNWPKRTPFKRLKGDATLKNQLANAQIDIITSGLQVDSQGKVNLKQSKLDLTASLKVIGDLGEHACRVNKRVKDIAIPVKCSGSFDTPPAELCSLDGKRLGKEIKHLAKKEAKRQVNKQVDKAVDKYLGKDNKINKKLKNIINKWF